MVKLVLDQPIFAVLIMVGNPVPETSENMPNQWYSTDYFDNLYEIIKSLAKREQPIKKIDSQNLTLRAILLFGLAFYI